MEIKKEELKKLSLQELKLMAKSHGLNYGGTKAQIIKSIIDYNTPDEVRVHSHPASLSGPDKKIIGIKLDEKEKQIQVGKEREKGRSKLLYYSMGVHYHEVNKAFEFI